LLCERSQAEQTEADLLVTEFVHTVVFNSQ